MKIKKVTALIAAAVFSVGTASVCSAEVTSASEAPEDYLSYKVYCYFDAETGENMHKLKNGSVYINKSLIPEEGAEFNIYGYICDKYKKATQIVTKYAFDNEGIYPTGAINTVEKFGQVYDEITDPQYSITEKEYNDFRYDIINYSLQGTSIYPHKVLTENTDDYPWWGLVAHVDKNCDYGRHKFFVVDKIPGWTNSQVTRNYLDKDAETGEYLFPGIYGNNPAQISPPQYIVVSDRELGDLDSNGEVNAFDADRLMDSLCYNENNMVNPSTEDNVLAAADVDEDGEVTAEDVEMVMDYVLSGEDISFYDYLENNNTEGEN